jgi:hypothetical protein
VQRSGEATLCTHQYPGTGVVNCVFVVVGFVRKNASLFLNSVCELYMLVGSTFICGINNVDSNRLITLVNTIFVTSKLFSVSDIIFYTEFKYVLSFPILRKVLRDIQL